MMIHSHIDPELPWGYWLKLDGSGSQTLTDDEGRKWPTIRDAFWQGRLGFKKVNERTGAPMLELLLAVLVNKSRRASWGAERQTDIFGGNTLLEHHFNLWMVREGFLSPGDSDVWCGGDITAEGWSVMLMLGATRPQPVRAMRPTSVSVQELVSLGIGPLPAKERMREVEAASIKWPAAFQRRTVGTKFTIALEKRDAEAPVPVMRTVWSQTFADERSRDAFFDWLCVRVDRWQEWATLAWSESGTALNGRLMSLIALCLADAELEGSE